MTIDSHLETYRGFPVEQYDPDTGLRNPNDRVYRLGLSWDDFDSGTKFLDVFTKLIADPACPQLESLIIGDWGGTGQGENSAAVVEALVCARDRLPRLRALFLGDIVCEESEVSWITQTDVSPLFEAFPLLEELRVRGGNGLSLGRPQHQHLRRLIIETGGMSANLLREVIAADLPRLEHLELWLGDDGYGNDITQDDLRALLASKIAGKLTYLGLRNDCRADDTARLLAEIGVPATVRTLDLSLGTLSDEGAGALAACGWLRSLEKLDLHHHYVSPEVVAKLEAVAREVDASDRQEPDVWEGESSRYVAVSE